MSPEHQIDAAWQAANEALAAHTNDLAQAERTAGRYASIAIATHLEHDTRRP